MSAVDVLAVLDAMFAAAADADSPCAITVRLLENGTVTARMSFAPRMETASGEGCTVAEAVAPLVVRVGGGK